MFETNFGEALDNALAQPEPTAPVVPSAKFAPRKLQPANSASEPDAEPPALENLIVSWGGGSEAKAAEHNPNQPGDDPHGNDRCLASGLVLYGNGHYVLLRGQVIPFGNTDKAQYDAGLCHLLSICEKSEDPVIADKVETSFTWSDGIFGFSGRIYNAVPKLMFPSLMRKQGENDREESLFPVVCISTRDEEGPAAKLINPLTQRSGSFTALKSESFGPLFATVPSDLTPVEEERLTMGLLSKFGLCKIYLTSQLGPECHSRHQPVEKFEAGYSEFIREPRTLEEVLKHQYAFGLVAPTYRLGNNARQLRRQLNIAAEIRRSQLTSCGRLS